MGGQGSGSYYHSWRGGKKTVVEGCRELDDNRWMREKILRAGVHQSGGWGWSDSRTGARTASLGCEVCTLDLGRPWLRLTYTVTTSGEQVEYHVGLTATRPHFGGLRWWFVC